MLNEDCSKYLKVGTKIITTYGVETNIVGFAKESISGNNIIIVDKECKGLFDEEYGYDRTYGDNYWIYPGEII